MNNAYGEALEYGGLRALRAALWEHGYICDVEGCSGLVVSQGGRWTDTGYWCLCGIHRDACRRGEFQPQMKQRALDREESRNPETGCLPRDKLLERRNKGLKNE